MTKKTIIEMACAFCIVFTALTLLNTILTLIGLQAHPPVENNISMFIFTFIGTSMLYTQRIFDDWSLLTILLIQYVIALTLIFLTVYVTGLFAIRHPDAYKDAWRSFTIPYVMGAAIYYYYAYKDAQKTNQRLHLLKSKVYDEMG